jgi:hypothetical protein
MGAGVSIYGRSAEMVRQTNRDSTLSELVNLDLTTDDRPSCDWWDCTNEAIWKPRLERQKCSHRFKTCSPCRDLAEADQELQKSSGNLNGWTCGTCYTICGYIIGWDPI